MHRFWSWVLLALATGFAADNPPAIQEALAALRRGDFASAEKTLQAEIQAHPEEAAALTLLGVALDSQQKFPQAEEMHRRAAASASNSPDVWNNYANHLLNVGDEAGARKCYLRTIALDPAHFNANVQLARLAVKSRQGAEALACLRRLPPAQQDAPNLAPLRLESLYLAGESGEADRLAARWLVELQGNLDANFAMGVALADAGQLEPAEKFFTQALAVAPSDFNVLFNLGIVEWHAGNLNRAREVLQTAEHRQPQNVELLYSLASVDQAAHHSEDAVALLARAARLAPQRADVQRLLALATADLGALDDSLAAWERYLRLQPTDDVGRRERGFTFFRMGRFDEAFADLRWFVDRHPNDAVGHFELATAENVENPAQALPEFDRALTLQPDFPAARSARGYLYYQLGKPEAALPDLEAAISLRPDDPVSLDRLGQTYQALDRTADALRVLRRAAALAPNDSKTQFHLARALADAGLAAESKAAMDRFRELGPSTSKGVPGGLVDYLNLTPEARRADYRKRVERMVHDHPDDPAALLNDLKLLVEEGEASQAVDLGRRIAALQSPPAVLAGAGRALLEARQYPAARELLEKAAAAASSPDIALDLAVAAFRASGPAEGIRLLDRIPEPLRSGVYFISRAEMLEAAGHTAEASAALDRALAATPLQPGLYLRAAAVLWSANRVDDALRVSAAALKAFPADRQLLLLRAITLDRAGRAAESSTFIRQLQSRWPEWQPAWTVEAVVLASHGRLREARAALDVASALGPPVAAVKAYFDALGAGAPGQPPDLIAILLAAAPAN